MRLNKLKALLGAISVSVLLSGCGVANQGNQNLFTQNQLVVERQTTKQEVESMFGKPDKIDFVLNREIWTYTAKKRGDSKVTQEEATMAIEFYGNVVTRKHYEQKKTTDMFYYFNKDENSTKQ